MARVQHNRTIQQCQLKIFLSTRRKFKFVIVCFHCFPFDRVPKDNDFEKSAEQREKKFKSSRFWKRYGIALCASSAGLCIFVSIRLTRTVYGHVFTDTRAQACVASRQAWDSWTDASRLVYASAFASNEVNVNEAQTSPDTVGQTFPFIHPVMSPLGYTARAAHRWGTDFFFFFHTDHSFVPLDRWTAAWSTHATLRATSVSDIQSISRDVRSIYTLKISRIRLLRTINDSREYSDAIIGLAQTCLNPLIFNYKYIYIYIYTPVWKNTKHAKSNKSLYRNNQYCFEAFIVREIEGRFAGDLKESIKLLSRWTEAPPTVVSEQKKVENSTYTRTYVG